VLIVKTAVTERQSSSMPSSGWVVDASVTMSRFFADEATPFTESLLDRLSDQPF
jgi:hypothetical protein